MTFPTVSQLFSGDLRFEPPWFYLCVSFLTSFLYVIRLMAMCFDGYHTKVYRSCYGFKMLTTVDSWLSVERTSVNVGLF